MLLYVHSEGIKPARDVVSHGIDPAAVLSIRVKMSLRNAIVGIIFIVVGIWFFVGLSTFDVEEGSDPKRIVIREGLLRSEAEVAEVLADEFDFDLDGAYSSGYTPRDVIEYLIKEPHTLSISFHNGRYYEGKTTILYIIPFSVCTGMILIGAVILLFTSRSKSGKS